MRKLRNIPGDPLDSEATAVAWERRAERTFAIRRKAERERKASMIETSRVPDPCAWCGSPGKPIGEWYGGTVMLCTNPKCGHEWEIVGK